MRFFAFDLSHLRPRFPRTPLASTHASTHAHKCGVGRYVACREGNSEVVSLLLADGRLDPRGVGTPALRLERGGRVAPSPPLGQGTGQGTGGGSFEAEGAAPETGAANKDGARWAPLAVAAMEGHAHCVAMLLQVRVVVVVVVVVGFIVASRSTESLLPMSTAHDSTRVVVGSAAHHFWAFLF